MNPCKETSILHKKSERLIDLMSRKRVVFSGQALFPSQYNYCGNNFLMFYRYVPSHNIIVLYYMEEVKKVIKGFSKRK